MEFLYRLEASTSDYFFFNLRKFKIDKKTKCGYFIIVDGKRKFTRANTLGCYAATNVKVAIDSFKKRRETYIKILKCRLELSQIMLFKLEGVSDQAGLENLESFNM